MDETSELPQQLAEAGQVARRAEPAAEAYQPPQQYESATWPAAKDAPSSLRAPPLPLCVQVHITDKEIGRLYGKVSEGDTASFSTTDA